MRVPMAGHGEYKQMEYLDCVFTCACMYVVCVCETMWLRGCMNKENVPQNERWAGQTVMLDQ